MTDQTTQTEAEKIVQEWADQRDWHGAGRDSLVSLADYILSRNNPEYDWNLIEFNRRFALSCFDDPINLAISFDWSNHMFGFDFWSDEQSRDALSIKAKTELRKMIAAYEAEFGE